MIEAIEKLKKITKNKNEAIELLEASLKRESFLEYMNKYFSDEDAVAEVDFSSFDIKLSENEFRVPHYKYHYDKIWEVLQKNNFNVTDCRNPVKWLSITYQLVKNKNIKPYYLAFFRGGDKGRINIKKALLYADKNEKQLFEVVRAIFRRTFGNITERRGKGVYQDIPFAIVWWQMYYAKEFEKSTSVSYKKIIKFFVKNKDSYNNFIIEGKKLTIIFDKNVRDGLFMYLLDKDIKTKEFKKAVKTIGIESAWRSLGSLSVEENKNIIESLV